MNNESIDKTISDLNIVSHELKNRESISEKDYNKIIRLAIEILATCAEKRVDTVWEDSWSWEDSWE